MVLPELSNTQDLLLFKKGNRLASPTLTVVVRRMTVRENFLFLDVGVQNADVEGEMRYFSIKAFGAINKEKISDVGITDIVSFERLNMVDKKRLSSGYVPRSDELETTFHVNSLTRVTVFYSQRNEVTTDFTLLFDCATNIRVRGTISSELVIVSTDNRIFTIDDMNGNSAEVHLDHKPEMELHLGETFIFSGTITSEDDVKILHACEVTPV